MADSIDITKFTEHCVLIRAIVEHSESLFKNSSEDDHRRMAAAAHSFFLDLNGVLNEWVILKVCMITDPATTRTREGELKNLTIAHLIQHYALKDDEKLWKYLEPMVARIEKLREKIVEARNKRIAHADHNAAFSTEHLGAASQREWDQFWSDLDEFINTVHKRVVGQPYCILGIGLLSDADTLLKALKFGACFEHLLHREGAEMTKKCDEIFFAIDNQSAESGTVSRA